ncbi:MAG TPA: hypothetical protein VLF63_01970 [Patescibacteria group bacterium]|nr:hypothetical protein [Patescibacteria group bacterium]
MPIGYESIVKKVPKVTLLATIGVLAMKSDEKPKTVDFADAAVVNTESINEKTDIVTGFTSSHTRHKKEKVHISRRLHPALWAASIVTHEMFREWSKVNVCEESGDWHVDGSTYAGGLGISRVNYNSINSNHHLHFPANEADATPDEQIVVARYIQTNPPDQNGCAGSW